MSAPTIRTIVFLIFFLQVISCEDMDPPTTRQAPPPNPMPRQSPPVAIAGPDISINFPENRLFPLDGSRSYDPDAGNYQIAFAWSKISGPDVNIQYPNNAAPYIVIGEPGSYVFELKVKDWQGLEAKDTVSAHVAWGSVCGSDFGMIKSSLEHVYTLEEQMPIDASILKADRYIILAGGRTEQDDGWGGYDIYASKFIAFDMVSRSTVKNELSLARSEIAIAKAGNQVFFAGGTMLDNVTDVVDIFDLSTQSLTVAKLSSARTAISSVGVGSKLFFVGGRNKRGDRMDDVDIYDINTKTWTTAKLSKARSGISVVTSGSKVFFAGGDADGGAPAGIVDVYDLSTGQWSYFDLANKRTGISAVAMGNDMYFVGGYDFQQQRIVHKLDIVNSINLAVKSSCIIAHRENAGSFGQNLLIESINNEVLYYFTNNIMTIYRPADQKWNVTLFPVSNSFIGIAKQGNQLYAIENNGTTGTNYYLFRMAIYKVNF